MENNFSFQMRKNHSIQRLMGILGFIICFVIPPDIIPTVLELAIFIMLIGFISGNISVTLLICKSYFSSEDKKLANLFKKVYQMSIFHLSIIFFSGMCVFWLLF
jgi:hypothetical protein